ncbi:MAG: hypothetical protein HYY96_06980 [Candidatus Tectomicrobia bacterium]|nr:hypothetical protein [Candidatus Tectomicrobia bacterium]
MLHRAQRQWRTASGRRRMGWLLGVLLAAFLGTFTVSRAAFPQAEKRAASSLQALPPGVTLGSPVEVRGYTIIPVVTMAVAAAAPGPAPEARPPAAGEAPSKLRGGLVSPVGLLVLSSTSVQFFPIRKGFVTQVLEASLPLAWQMLREPRAAAPPERGTGSRTLAALLRLLDLAPEQGLRFGIIPWPFRLLVLFYLGWLGLAVLASALFPNQIEGVALYGGRRPVRAFLLGLVMIAALVALGALLLVSVAGIPALAVVALLGLVLKLFGMVALALLIGRPLAGERRVLGALVGALAVSLIGFVPYLGWMLWALLAVVGIGACAASGFGTRRLAA